MARRDEMIRAMAEIKEAQNDEGRTDEEKQSAREQAVEAIRNRLKRDEVLGRGAPGRGSPRGVPNRAVEPE